MDSQIGITLNIDQHRIITRAAAGLNISVEQYLQRVTDRHIEAVKTRFGSSPQPKKTKH